LIRLGRDGFQFEDWLGATRVVGSNGGFDDLLDG
jgi:hypothetical protein